METPKPQQRWTTWMWVGIVALGASARLIPHPWNFTPLVAMGVFAGMQARRTGLAALVTLLSLALSDLVLGFYHGFWWIYAAALVPVLVGRLARNRAGVLGVVATVLGSSLFFFLASNFAVWAAGQIYPPTLAGLAACYVAAIPFYGNQLAGDAFYAVLLFGGYSLLTRWMPRAPQPTAA